MDCVRCFYILRNFQRPLLQCSTQGEEEMRTEKERDSHPDDHELIFSEI